MAIVVVIVFVMDGPAGGSAAFNTHSLSPVLFSRIVHDSQMKKPKPPLPLPPFYCLLCVCVWGARLNKKLDEAACLLIMP